MLGPSVSLNAATAAGIGASFSAFAPNAKWGLQVSFTGTPANCIVTLDVSVDGVNWFTILTWTKASQASGDILFVADKPAVFARANCTSFSAGAGNTVTATLCGT